MRLTTAGRVALGGGLSALRKSYSERPLATATALFGVIAVVRISGAYLPTALLVSFALTPAVLLAAPHGQLRAMGLRPPGSASSLARGVAVVILAYVVTVGACVLVFGVGRDNWASGLLTVFEGSVPTRGPGHTAVALIIIVVTLAVVVPLAEEVCFRGLLMHAVATRHGPVVAVVTTSAAWALVHLGDYGLSPLNPQVILGALPSVFVMGLALGWCRVATGSVYACAAAQGIANLLLAAWVSRW